MFIYSSKVSFTLSGCLTVTCVFIFIALIFTLSMPKVIKAFADNADSGEKARNELPIMKSAFVAT